MTATLFAQLFFDGLATGLVFVILACGFIIIISISKIMFLAYGAFYTIGAYITWYAIAIPAYSLPLWAHYRSGQCSLGELNSVFTDLPASQVKIW